MLKQSLVLTKREDIETILQGCKTCRIAMVDEGRPYIIPMVFGYRWDGADLVLYFHCGLRGRKNRALRNNPQVCFEMDIEGELIGSGEVANRYSRAFSSLIGEGKVEFAQDLEQRRQGFEYIMRHQTGRGDYTYMDAYLAIAEVFWVRADSFKATRKLPPAGHPSGQPPRPEAPKDGVSVPEGHSFY